MRVEPKSFYADLFTKRAGPGRDLVAVDPPVAGPPAPELPAVSLPAASPEAAAPAAAVASLPAPKEPSPPLDSPLDSPVAETIGAIDTHHLSPRQMANLSLDLYAAGAISFDDYSLLAFQPELHPDFERTIGALTGEAAEPDRPRDFVRLWDDRADFQRRHNHARKDLIEQSERIATFLRQIDSPMNMVV